MLAQEYLPRNLAKKPDVPHRARAAPPWNLPVLVRASGGTRGTATRSLASVETRPRAAMMICSRRKNKVKTQTRN